MDARNTPPDPAAARWAAWLLLVPVLWGVLRDLGQVVRPAPPPDPSPAWAQPRRVALDVCDRGELLALPGVGPVLAERILAARAERPFTQLADLERVPGVGPIVLRRLAPHVVVSERGRGN